MIQFNLLPDVKLEYVKAQRTKRLVIGISLIATASTFVIFLLLLLTVQGIQRASINGLSSSIQTASKSLQQTPDLNKILTIQNQLSALSDLHNGKFVASRIFGLMRDATPSDVTISDQAVDFTANTMTITGNAPSLDRVNVFTDTLKFATYTSAGDSKNAFSQVVLSQFTRNDTGTTYTITLTFDPALFNIDQNASLTIPKTVTTRSITEQPAEVFQKSSSMSGGGQ